MHGRNLYTSYKLIIFFLLFSFIAASYSTAAMRMNDDIEKTVAPGRAYEECFGLYMGQTVHYSFTSSNPLDFNIHYHAADEVVFPVQEKNTRAQRGTFVCNEQKYYEEENEAFCMMWENHGEAFVNLKFKYKVRPDTPEK